MIRLLFALWILVAPLAGTAHSYVRTVNILHAIEKLSSNPMLSAARTQYSRALLAKSYAASTLLPDVNVSISKTVANNPNDTYTNVMQISVAQPVFSFGSSMAAYKKADESIISASYHLLGIEQNIVLSAAKAYLDVIRTRRIVNINEHNVVTSRKFLSQTKARFAKGDVTKTDVALAQSNLEGAISELTSAENACVYADAVYAQIIGEDPLYNLAMPSMESSVMPGSIKEAVGLAMTSNNDLQQYSHNYKAKQHAEKIAAANLLPSVSAYGQFTRQPIVTPVILPSGGAVVTSGPSISFSVSIPVLRKGGADLTALQDAEYSTKGAYFDYQSAKRDVDKQVVAAWGNLNAFRSKIRSNEEALKAARIALDGVMNESAAGFRTSFEVLQAEQQVLLASVKLEDSRFSYMVALYSLLHVMGRLTIEDLLRTM